MVSDINLQISWNNSNVLKNKLSIKTELKNKIKEKFIRILKLLEINGSYILEIELISKEKIRELNKEYRDKNKSTDVLSFPTYIKFSDTANTQILGTIFICVDHIFSKKNTTDQTISKNLHELTIHGFIHTLGFDHETDPEAWKNLEKNIK
ncbi:rRNA maturation RNase YbeY [Patescibacteria group bacterium]